MHCAIKNSYPHPHCGLFNSLMRGLRCFPPLPRQPPCQRFTAFNFFATHGCITYPSHCDGIGAVAQRGRGNPRCVPRPGHSEQRRDLPPSPAKVAAARHRGVGLWFGVWGQLGFGAGIAIRSSCFRNESAERYLPFHAISARTRAIAAYPRTERGGCRTCMSTNPRGLREFIACS